MQAQGAVFQSYLAATMFHQWQQHTHIHKNIKTLYSLKFRMHGWSCLAQSVNEEEEIINSLTSEILNAANWPDSMSGRGRETTWQPKKLRWTVQSRPPRRTWPPAFCPV
jgi:hypothetical protein